MKDYLFSCISGWVSEFDIDGLRLDVAYCLKPEFIRELRAFCDGLKPDFFLVGELLHGDYNRWVGEGCCTAPPTMNVTRGCIPASTA